MALLDDAVQAAGGMELWRRLSRFTVHLSMGGELLTRMYGTSLTKDVVVQGAVHEQSLEITGFTASDRRALYRPDWLALEGSDGGLLKERRTTAAVVRRSLRATVWDELQLAFYCGSLIRSYLDVPFILSAADVVAIELPPSTRREKRLRALQVQFPERLATHSDENTFYFDGQALLRRQEYRAPQDGTTIAQTFSGHQRYSGILIPTLSRLLVKGSDGAIIARPSLVDIEIFDASFD